MGIIDSLTIDHRKTTFCLGMALFMLIFLLVGLNSNSWYIMENSDRDGDPDQGLYVDETVSFQFGLSNIEISYEADGIAYGIIDYESSESIEFNGNECNSSNEDSQFQNLDDCESAAFAGTMNQISLLVSIICLFVILSFGIIGRYVRKQQVYRHEQKILNVAWILATFLPFIGTICYGFIVAKSEFVDVSDLDQNGFGFMWWGMLVFSFTCIVLRYNQQLYSIISSPKTLE